MTDRGDEQARGRHKQTRSQEQDPSRALDPAGEVGGHRSKNLAADAGEVVEDERLT